MKVELRIKGMWDIRRPITPLFFDPDSLDSFWGCSNLSLLQKLIYLLPTGAFGTSLCLP